MKKNIFVILFLFFTFSCVFSQNESSFESHYERDYCINNYYDELKLEFRDFSYIHFLQTWRCTSSDNIEQFMFSKYFNTLEERYLQKQDTFNIIITNARKAQYNDDPSEKLDALKMTLKLGTNYSDKNQKLNQVLIFICESIGDEYYNPYKRSLKKSKRFADSYSFHKPLLDSAIIYYQRALSIERVTDSIAITDTKVDKTLSQSKLVQEESFTTGLSPREHLGGYDVSIIGNISDYEEAAIYEKLSNLYKDLYGLTSDRKYFRLANKAMKEVKEIRLRK